MIKYISIIARRFTTIKRNPLYLNQTIPSSLKPNDFLGERHIGPNQKEIGQMLKICKADTLEGLVQSAITSKIRDENPLPGDLQQTQVPEYQFINKFKEISKKNLIYKSYLGGGFYNTILPAVIQRNLLENPGWYTSYTPYQGQVSQGRLESLLNYQTLICEMTGLPCSNASLLDEASAGGEAFFLSYGTHNMDRKKVFIDKNVFITTQEVIRTKAKFLDVQVVVGNYNQIKNLNLKEFCGFIVQTPDANGVLHDFTQIFNYIDSTKSQTVKIVACDLLSLTLSKNPGKMGADLCFGTSQRFGVPMGYGGPNAAFFSSKSTYLRKLPGRIIGISKDASGNQAYRMSLQTREQHIRRQKATSNICTAQALLANIAAMYAVYHGPKGLRKIGERVNGLTQQVAQLFQGHGFKLLKGVSNNQVQFFDTLTVLDVDAQRLTKLFLDEKINIRKVSNNQISLSFDQTTTLEDVIKINQILSKYSNKTINSPKWNILPLKLSRPVDYLNQSVFNSIHSETQMLRYLFNLQSKDLSLNKSMIPLGSCTMKLNASSQMIPITWPEFNLHPFVPVEQAKGYQQIINELSEWLKSVTKFDAISLQPNSGAAGQYTGLLVINQYNRSKGEGHRRICLIPRSAHGTNPASAYIAGFKVIPIEVNDGVIDIDDLKKNAQKYQKELGALMITFPSTAGIYEQTVKQACQIAHKYGAQVYMDGANMNAQVGWTSPGFLGADVCHLNLHKTFAIPHGGGGPGMGPIGVKKHLIPYLPTHPLFNYTKQSLGAVTSTPFGSASILNISYAYIAMLGKNGIKNSTSCAILNANYLMYRLKQYYKILFVGEGKCSHEFIMDIRPIKQKTGVSQQDIAKRLMDYGFHAPTMSFPIPGTLMIQPTESQDKGELDRFADALINIRKQIDRIPSVLKNAPHTVNVLLKTEWKHDYTREEAAFPLPWVKTRGKFWPTVSRIDNPYGDKNLVCSCPDIDNYFDQ